MKQPCNNCPFRSDVLFPLSRSRRQDILDSIFQNGDFPCHKTTEFNDDGKIINIGKTKRCIGVAIFLEKYRIDGGLRANLAFRMALCFKEFTLSELDLNYPIYSPSSFISYD